MKRAVFLAVFFLGLLSAPATIFAQKSYSATDYSSNIRVMEGGDLEIQETITFDFAGGPFSYVYRDLSPNYSDGIEIVSAGVDGRVWPAGSAPGQVEITGGDPLKVTWHLEPTSDRTHAFELNYRLRGVIRQSEQSDLLRFRPLPDSYEYVISQANMVITYPPSIDLIGSARLREGSGQITGQAGRVQAFTGRLAPNTPFEIEIAFPAGSLITQPPQWQIAGIAAQVRRAEQADQGVIWLLASGMFIVVGAVAAFYLARRNDRRKPSGRSVEYKPPNTVAPAIVGILRTISGTPAWHHALGTLFDLANRDLIQIDEIGKRKWYQSRDFQFRLLAWPTGLWPHEQALLELLFVNGRDRRTEPIRLSQMSSLITSSRWKLFKESLKAELKASGLWSKEQEVARNRMIYTGIGFLILMVLCLPLIIVIFDQTGFWSIALPVALALLSITWVVAGSTIPIWSEAGLSMAAEWDPFYHYIRQVGRGKISLNRTNEFDQYLPYATAFGLLYQWVKRFEKEGWQKPPAYFHALGHVGQESMAAFVVMAHSAGISGGSAASTGAVGGAGGAAGGGASGAG